MTKTESGLSRWSRLKQEHARGIEPDSLCRAPNSPAEQPADLSAATGATQTTDLPVPPPVDLANLPAIESITAGTDIRSFLGSSVPAELARAALRRAWATDPVISGFIGIAESQWDFNDPTAMPGFGPLEPSDDVPSLLAQIFDKMETSSEALMEASDTVPPVAADPVIQGGGSADELQTASVLLAAGVPRGEMLSPAEKQDPSSRKAHDVANTIGDPAADSAEG